MIYGFDFTDKICYISKHDKMTAEDLPVCSCPIDIEERIAWMNTYLTSSEDKAVAVVEKMTKEVLDAAVRTSSIVFFSKEEAFAEYLLWQEEGVWKRNAAVFEFHKKSFIFYSAICRGKILMTEKEVIVLPERGFASAKEKDKFFTKWIAKTLNHRNVDIVYLIGEEFEGKWMELSLSSVCHGRRVFMGNHLFSTGGMMSLVQPKEKKEMLMTEDDHPYIWGIRAFHHGQKDVFVPIIQPGEFWFRTHGSVDVLMDECEELEIEGMHFVSRKEIKLILPLHLKQQHPMKTTKIKIQMNCIEPKTLEVEVYDMGFGMSRKGSGLIYKEVFKLP